MSPSPRPRRPRPGRPKDPAKRQAILEAAKRLFPEHGYEGVSMESIALAAAVSKLTLYSHFRDKDALFAAAVKAVCEEQLPPEVFSLGPEAGNIGQILHTIAERFLGLVSRKESVQVYRMLAAQAPGNSKLAELFFDAGPRRALDEFETLLRQADRAGALSVPDPARSAGHFFCLLKGLWHMRRLIGCGDSPESAPDADHLDSVVDLFLRAHAPESTPRQSSQ